MNITDSLWQKFATTGKIFDYLEYCNYKNISEINNCQNVKTGGENYGNQQGTTG